MWRSSMSRDVRILLIGLGPTALSALRGLGAWDVRAVIRPDDGGRLDEAVREEARRQGAAILRDCSITGVETALQRHDPDAVVVSSYDRIIPERMLLERPWINVHYAPLPHYRGRAVVNWAILNGERQVHVSVHSLVAELDAGGILASGAVAVPPRATVGELYEALNSLQERLLPQAVQRRLSGDEGDPQEAGSASYCCTRVPEDGEIDWTQPTAVIDRLIRALGEPYPGAYTWLGLQKVRVDTAAPSPDRRVWVGRVPGRVVNVSRAEGWVDVLTGDGSLRLMSVSVDDAAPVPAATVAASVKQTFGLRTADLVRALRIALGEV
jgi:methionyl-tRNA formyltransferase